ncbi:MAG TPA: low temperature requirement protein A [Rugosimonospora sp.]|jgi:low temperature requirement protein LtrA
MTNTRAAALTRSPGGSQRATLLELFFDLVFVAALALTSLDFARDVSWVGAIRALIPLTAIWWVWQITTLVTDFYDPSRLPIQAIVAGTMLGSILLTATLPEAFGKHGVIFAFTYVAIHLGRGAVLVTIQRGLAQIRAARFMIWFAVSATPWILGAFTRDFTQRAELWGLASTIDYVIGGFRYPTPWLGRVPLMQYDQAGRHLGERYQQFMILALGDLILIPTLTFGQTRFTAARTGAFLAAFAATALLWQIYVYRAGLRIQTVIDRNPGRVVRWAPYTQVVMAAGIVALGSGFELVIGRPTGAIPTGWIGVLFGGPALFLIGRITFEYQMFRRVSRSRLGWLIVLIAVTPGAARLSPLLAVVVLGLVLLGIAITDTLRGRADPHASDAGAAGP